MTKEFSRVFIKDQAGQILVLRDKKRPDVWNIPGGQQEFNEKPVDCAIREVKEELNLEISQLEEIYHADLTFNETVWGAHFYFAHVAQGKPTLNEPNKIIGVQFIADLTMAKFSEGLAPLFNYLVASHKLADLVTEWP